jgi:pyruvate dehydrogenase E1 component alpha subunit
VKKNEAGPWRAGDGEVIMPRKVVYQAAIEYLQILDEEGHLDAELAEGTLSDAEVKSLYTKMIICREFDETAFKLQRSGRMGTFPQNKGQEATSLGAARALRKGVDHIVPYYRDNPALFLHGLPMHDILLHWMGDERGNAIPKDLAISAVNLIIGTQALHAAGIGWAFKLRKEQKAVLCFFGEGATSTGDFHEAMNFASVMKLPVVFCCVNNAWAISTPTGKQSASETFAQKALAYGMPTMQVDGNDLFAVYKSHHEAIERARSGDGPSFIESLTYRLGDHTTADDARRYRDTEELTAAQKRDPLTRTRKFLESRGLWNEQDESHAWDRARTIVREATRAALEIEKPPVTDLFDHTFAELPPELQRQRETMRTDSIGQELPGQERPAPASQVNTAPTNGKRNGANGHTSGRKKMSAR